MATSSQNIVIINLDDISAGITTQYPTPSIAALAAEGTTVESMSTAGHVCSPGRVGMHSGRWPGRYGAYGNPEHGDNPPRYGLPGSATTIAEVLKARGRRTSIVGKWHIGIEPDQLPGAQGYDESLVFLAGGHAYKSGTIIRNGRNEEVKGYLTDIFADEAVAFIRRQGRKKQPFYLELQPNAPHGPLSALAADMAKCGERTGDARTFCGMLVAADRLVGRVIAELRARGFGRNTLVVFTGDNGCVPTPFCDPTPWRGSKGSVYEGSSRVDGIFWQPGLVPAGAKYGASAISQIDLFPTALAAVGGTLPKDLDGIDVLPAILASKPLPSRALFWAEAKNKGSIRTSEWRLYLRPGLELYDLRSDPGESRNVASSQAAVVADLRPRLVNFLASLPPPAY